MTAENQDELTFDGLQKFLFRVGFEQPARVKQSLAFRHPASGTIIVLSIPADNRTVRPADLLSVLMRLEYAGLASDAELLQFRAGKLPLAS
ncbi:hypothetical protein [Anatilimnocola floriformis]|uniref:hypothetical protein n=1 Tax=Anatilimnocola floriformis TaxID=2948575 RepID=UPI0020C1CACA|nr:hypothetical protein [Anatilimnocola floriformis]